MARILRGLVVAVAVALVSASAASADRIYAYGTSYVAGLYGGTPLSDLPAPFAGAYMTPWVTQAASGVHVQLINRAVSGSEADTTIPVVDRTWPRGFHDPHSSVVLETGLNDLRHYGISGLTEYERNVRRMLLRFSTAQPKPTIYVIDEVPIINWGGYAPADNGTAAIERLYDTELNVIAHHFRNVVVVNPRIGWDARTMISPDGVHPSALGSAHIADMFELAYALHQRAERLADREPVEVRGR